MSAESGIITVTGTKVSDCLHVVLHSSCEPTKLAMDLP